MNLLHRSTRAVIRLVFLALLGPSLMASSCESLAEAQNDVPVTILKTNLDVENVHIFSRFENFPCCRVSPGQTDSSTEIRVREGEAVQFTAGRSEALIPSAATTCTVSSGLYFRQGVRTARVEFGIDETLRCVGW